MRKIYRRVLLTVLVIAIALGVWAVNTGFRQLRLYSFIVYARAFLALLLSTTKVPFCCDPRYVAFVTQRSGLEGSLRPERHISDQGSEAP